MEHKTQSNLAKAASNAPHAQDFVVVAVREICRRSQNLKVGHVTPPMAPNNLLCVVLDRIHSHVYMHTKFLVSSFSRSGDTRGVPKFKCGSRDPAPTTYELLLHSFC